MSEKKKKIRSVIVISVSALIGAIGGALGVGSGIFDSMTGMDGVVFIISLVIWLMLGIVIHELGHLVFGWTSGYTFGFFKLGSLSWFKEDGMIKFKRSKNFAAGQCLMIPPDNEAEFKFLLYNLGGVIFNFLTVLVTLLIWFLFFSDHLLRHFILAGVIINLLLGITNLIPMRSQGNDGANILEALKSADGRHALYLLFYINGQRMEGKRLSEITTDVIRIYGKLDADSFLVGNALMYEIEYLIHSGQFEKALEICQAVDVDKYPIIHGQLFSLYQLTIYLTYLPDLKKAKAIYEEKAFQTFLKMKLPSVTAVLVAYEFFVNNNDEKAEKLMEQAKIDIANIPNKGEKLEMRDYLAHLEEKMALAKV